MLMVRSFLAVVSKHVIRFDEKGNIYSETQAQFETMYEMSEEISHQM